MSQELCYVLQSLPSCTYTIRGRRQINKITVETYICSCSKCCEGKLHVLFEFIIGVFDIAMVVREDFPEEASVEPRAEE